MSQRKRDLALSRKQELRVLVKDIEANGFIYIKSHSVIQELLEIEPSLRVTYNKEDDDYIVEKGG